MIRTLPDFSDPPLIEVVLSLQFDVISTLTIPQIGLLYQEYNQRFPIIDENAPLDPEIERLGVRVPKGMSRIEFKTSAPIPRIWFIDEEKRELIQVQKDRFIRNWRKITEKDEYPRYDNHIRPEFISDYEIFEKFVSNLKDSQININQCEVTYINHIFPNSLWNNHADYQKLFSVINNFPEVEGTVTENFQFTAKNLIVDEKGEFIGRLIVNLVPAYRVNDKGEDTPIFELQLTARGKPIGADKKSALKFFDLGRMYIIRMFTEITTPEMHKIWGRKDNE